MSSKLNYRLNLCCSSQKITLQPTAPKKERTVPRVNKTKVEPLRAIKKPSSPEPVAVLAGKLYRSVYKTFTFFSL